MIKPVFLSRPAMVSALGYGVHEHISALLAREGSYLTSSDYWVSGQSYLFGTVQSPLRPFPADLRPDFCSRNNQLLWHALFQIEDDIQTTIAEYGADRVAVVLGTSTTGGDENRAALEHGFIRQDWANSGYNQALQLMSSPADFVAHVYQLSNVHYGISTACTSGARALISAARLLRMDMCDAVICGGVDTLSALTINGFHALQVLSPGQCQPFTAARNGINIGEAAAVFVMTRDSTKGLPLLGYGSSSDAYHMSSPRPDATGARKVIQQALQKAQLPASAVGWVNLHGTGTIQNDAMEALAIHSELGAKVSCASTKALTGHTLGAAGALEAAFLWTVISQQTNPAGELPPHRANAHIDPALAPIHLTSFQETFAADCPRIALSTSFAFGGNNTALIMGSNDANPNL
ncbi:beta-ketoacyl-ACP synthase [Snodgrassella gandavensis]|uniref:beta-ketoacyl-ACP synthase n=1 Tax=Snodgrassella gandavensis TaxID=2946698 RepID=UPI001EF68005|nr:beta-ketoacyl-ACP synthase [Snodgrassella gandavensis]